MRKLVILSTLLVALLFLVACTEVNVDQGAPADEVEDEVSDEGVDVSEDEVDVDVEEDEISDDAVVDTPEDDEEVDEGTDDEEDVVVEEEVNNGGGY